MSLNTGKHALVIDDNTANVEIISALLKVQGVRVSSYVHPDRATEALPGIEPVHVVFCDLEMPRLSGYEMLVRLRAAFGRHVPIIAYTVHTSEIDQARRNGFDGFLGKPLDGERFGGLLERIFRGMPVWELP